MNEPPANWDQQDEENPSSLSSTTTKLANLNVNAYEFVPSFGLKTTTVQASSEPKTPPSTPVIARHTNEHEVNRTEQIIINTNEIESNNEQQMEQDFPNSYLRLFLFHLF
jgi:hypothetical protein